MEPLTAASPNHYSRGGQLHKDGRWLIAANLDAEAERRLRPTGSTGTICKRTKDWFWPDREG